MGYHGRLKEMRLAEPADTAAERVISFGPFHLSPSRRLLLEGDKPVRVGSRALEILIALVERPGDVVGKDELIARAWPRTFVEEGNLKFQVSALRQAIGDGHAGNRYIATLPGRGYSFVARVRLGEDALTVSSTPADPTIHRNNLPAQLTRLIGRADIVEKLISQLPRQRLVTIVGPGGVGKTSVALAAAEGLLTAYEHGVWLVDLALLDDARLVPSALATALGLEIRSDNPLPSLMAGLSDKRMLLVFDNCAHVIEAAASLAISLLTVASSVHILATSREPLRVEGERVYRLSPLAIPSGSSGLTAAEALVFPAVQLFVERAAANLDQFELSDGDAPFVIDICRKLDGLPLAIEFAAARVEALGLRNLTVHLDAGLRLLTAGRRTAVPRHRTLTATLDWSYQLLTETEQSALRRSAIFAGGFTLPAASAVIADAHPAGGVAEQVAELGAKSLVVADVSGAEPRFRLLDTTRAYALEQLLQAGEVDAVGRRHAEYYRDLLEAAAQDQVAMDDPFAVHAAEIDNVRAALTWAFESGGDPTIGVALTAAAVPVWMRLSLVEECRGRIEQALAYLADGATRDSRSEMRLHAALGIALDVTRGAAAREIGASFKRALDIAEQLDNAEYQLRSLWGLWNYYMNSGQPQLSLTSAERFCRLAEIRSNPNERLIGEGMIGLSHHLMGDQPSARRHLEHVVPRYRPPDDMSDIIRFHFDQRVTAHIYLARVLWLLGFPDMAMHAAHSGVEEARATNDPGTLCSALAQTACQIALWVGNSAVAEQYIGMLLDQSTTRGLAVWLLWARSYQGELFIKRGDVIAGLQLLQSGLGQPSASRSALRSLTFLPVLAEALGQDGQTADGLAAIGEALDVSERTDLRWRMSELLRIKGEVLLLQGAPGASAAAEDCFQQALDWAHRQGALSWELRAATSLARLQRDQNRVSEAWQLLSSVYARFTEGFGTTDLTSASTLLNELRPTLVNS